METITATSSDEFNTAIAAHAHVLVDFHKDNCPGCRMLDASLQKFSATPAASGVTLLKVKLETVGEDFFHGLGLRQTPTLALFRDGQEVARLPGFQTPAQVEQAAAAAFA
ncbi:MAG: thioredoxin family protein [Stenotrophomonas sp.]